MSVAISGFGAVWLLAGDVLCNILMACYRCFAGLSMGRICLSHHIAIYACPIPRDFHYNINMEYNSIKIIKFMKV